jgi:ABC-type lipoprotein release transport system permease subunit
MIHVTLIKVSVEVALRNLFLHKVRTIVVGGILAGCTFLLAVGLSLLQSIENSMRNSVTGSVTGHLQVYAADARDSLSLFGGGFAGKDDNGQINSFSAIEGIFLNHPNVKNLVPQGFDMALLSRGNVMDETFDALRETFKKTSDEGQHGLAIQGAKEAIEVLRKEQDYLRSVVGESPTWLANQANLKEVSDESFWMQLQQSSDKEPLFQKLETRIAPISGEKAPVYLRFMGTDILKFGENFQKFKLISGRTLVPGANEILMNQKFYDDFLRNIVARYMDKLEEGIRIKENSIKGTSELQTIVSDLPKQAAAVMRAIHPEKRSEVAQKLVDFLKVSSSDPLAQNPVRSLDSLLRLFLTLEDANALERVDFFKEQIKPFMKLYEIGLGDMVMLRSYTKRGYLRSVGVKVVGTYGFSGIEKSDLAGVFNIINLETFRELYGQMSSQALEELEQMRAGVNLKSVSRESAEDALFGESSDTPAPVEPTPTPAPSQADRPETDLIINAAVILKDPNQWSKTLRDLQNLPALKENNLQVVAWKDAAGMVGRFVDIVRMILFTSVGVIFVVALVIINNAMVMATVERTQEIGTIRALGGQKSFILFMFLTETFVTSLIAALLGIGLAGLFVSFLGTKGIPANVNVLTFLFGGPRLYPQIVWEGFLLSPILISIISVISTLYPAFLAARVSPAVAMQERE